MSKFLESNRLFLRSVEKADLPVLSGYLNDKEVRLLTGEVHPTTEKGLEEFYERTQKNDNRIWFVIVDKDNNQVIGETGFLRIFYPWRTADLTIVIWNKDYWGKGFGKEAAGLMLDYAFNHLNFHRLSIGVVGFNERAVKFWESIGFKQEGIQRDGYFCNGGYSDFIMMSLLETDYITPAVKDVHP